MLPNWSATLDRGVHVNLLTQHNRSVNLMTQESCTVEGFCMIFIHLVYSLVHQSCPSRELH